MKAISISTMMLCAAISVCGQKQHNNWYFGNNAAISFASGSPVAFSGSNLATQEGCASVSDPATGNTLFYTNGIKVWDRNNSLMPNGSSLAANSSSTQAAMIIPFVGNPNRHYIFTTGSFLSNGFRYSVVDMTLNGGMGDVVSTQKNVVMKPSTSERVNATMHSNGTDIWVVSHDHGSNTFNAYLVTASGITTSPVVSSVGFSPAVAWGSLKFSHKGDKLILLAYSGTGNNAQMFNFDRTTGIVSSPMLISNTLTNPYSAAFSPNDSVFYIGYYHGIAQFQTYGLIPMTQQFVAAVPGVAVLQLGPDCKIYCSPGYGATSLSMIADPDNVINPMYIPNVVPLSGGGTCTNGLPNLFQSGTFSCQGNTLPVELLYFRGENEGAYNKITWATASERNSDYFLIERSCEQAGMSPSWEAAGIRPAMGDSYWNTEYQFPDNLDAAGCGGKTIYYRLKQVDLNGRARYSETIAITTKSHASEGDILARPNPASDVLHLALRHPGTEMGGQWVIRNLLGNVVMQLPVNSGSLDSMDINISDLPDGVYLVSFINELSLSGLEGTGRCVKITKTSD